jgi:hypothetical protein
VFFKTIAYLDLPDENNKPYLARCSLREQVARAIAEWDQPGGTMKPGSYYLYPPTPGRTMAAMVARDRARPHAVKLAKQAKATAKKGTRIIKTWPCGVKTQRRHGRLLLIILAMGKNGMPLPPAFNQYACATRVRKSLARGGAK